MPLRPRIALASAVSLLAFAAAGAAQAQSPGATELEAITVEGEGGGGTASGAPGVATNDGYVAKTTRTATKTDTPVHETPQTINTVTQKQLQDRRPSNLLEALAYTPGASVGLFGFDPRYDAFKIRGADVTYTGVFRDGLRQFNSPNGLFRLEPYGLESISILKGPASAIYGASASAGIVDLVTKRPTDYAFGEVEAQTGSFDRIQGAFDFGGPVNAEGTVTYRLTGVARDAGTELKAVPDDRVYIAPAVTFKPSDDTKLTILSEFMDSTTGGSAAYQNSYSPDFSLSLGAVPIPLGLKDYNDFEQQQGRVGYEFEHRFNDVFSIHQNLRYSALSTDQGYSGSQFFDTGRIKEKVQAFAADTFLKTKVDTGPVGHTILTGLDYGYSAYRSKTGYGSFTDPNDIPTPLLRNKDRQKQQLVGLYVQDEVKLDRWRLLLGGRHDWFDSEFRSDQPQLGAPYDGPDKQNKGKFTGRAALSYVAPQGFTPYVSYGTSFTPNAGAVIDGSVAKPTTGETVEGGVKYAIPGTNAAINASVYSLTQKDGVVFLVDGGANEQNQLDFRSRGFEIEGTASLANGVNLLASYDFTDTKILDPDNFKGNKLSSIPKHAFKLWAGYDAKDGPLKGLGIGAGVRYSGRSEGDELNRAVISNKARAFVDAKVSYDFGAASPQLKGLSVQVNAQNLFDSVKQMCSSNYCYYDEGRKVVASLRYRW